MAMINFSSLSTVQAAEDENLLLAGAQLAEADAQVFEQLLGLRRVFGGADRGGDALQHVQRDIFLQRARLDSARAQMIQRKVARGLIDEGFEVVDRPLTEGAGHTQVGFLQQVFGGAGVIHHPLQRA